MSCEVCGQDMLKANGCCGKQLRIDGKLYTRILYGNEDLSGLGFEPNVPERCGDCGCKKGFLHHWGCDLEVCPKCGRRLLSCECDDVVLIVTEEEEAEVKANTEAGAGETAT